MRKREAEAINRVLRRFADGDYSPLDRRNISAENLRILEAIRSDIEKKALEVRKTKLKNATDAAGVAHDLKTPLSVIIGAAECLKDGMDDKDYCSIISEKAVYMSELIDNLTDSARQISGDESDFKETVNAKTFLEAEFNRQRLLVERTKLKLRVGRVPKNVFIVINRKKISRVIQNIITNAVKYSGQGKQIKVRFGVHKGRLSIAVKDRGEGIAEENLPYVFDKFFMEDSARSGLQAGSSGLGLFVVKEIVEEHGGNVGVKSKKDKGSTFYIELPIKPNAKKTATDRFDAHSIFFKLHVVLFFGFIYGCIYRFVRFGETHYASTLYGAFLSIFLMPFMWITDIVSVIFYGRIAFLAD